MARNENRTREQRARERAEYLSGLVWHAGTFLIINVFFWFLDGAGAGGVNWAPWITVVWAVALAFHALAYFVDGRQLEDRMTEQYLREDVDREREHHDAG